MAKRLLKEHGETMEMLAKEKLTEWWKDWFDFTDFCGDIGGFVWVLKGNLTPSDFIDALMANILAESRRRTLAEVAEAARD